MSIKLHERPTRQTSRFNTKQNLTLTRTKRFPLLFSFPTDQTTDSLREEAYHYTIFPVLSVQPYITDAWTASMNKPQSMPIPPGTSLEGKTILVTGGNSGLGLEFARQSLTLTASRVIITVFSQAKGDAALATLRADPEIQATNPDARLEYFHLDLGDYGSGREFVQKVYAEVPELDILLCNGGTNIFHYEVSKSGHERLMQGTYPLTTTEHLEELVADTHSSSLLHSLPRCPQPAPPAKHNRGQTWIALASNLLELIQPCSTHAGFQTHRYRGFNHRPL
jgi:hypothetical protein